MQPFFVHIIESPSSTDLLEGDTEGRVLVQALALSRIPHYYNLVTSLQTLDDALGIRLQTARLELGKVPVLHLSCHGNRGGICLTSGEFVSWRDLRDRLLPLNTQLEGGLLLTMSSCFGLSGREMAMRVDGPVPFFAIVAHPNKVRLSDLAVAFTVFYHHIGKGGTMQQCVEAMKAASGEDRFEVSYGPRIQQSVSALYSHLVDRQRNANG